MNMDYNFSVWCDKKSDLELWFSLCAKNPLLSSINNVNVLPSYKEVNTNPKFSLLREIVLNDRFDFVVCIDDKPILCVEITEHGYTGDNPLQRFARIARAAELGIPAFYVAPFKRTRLDEMLVTDKQTSMRHISFRMFQGMLKLQDMYKVPNFAIDWPTNIRGQPIPITSTDEPGLSIIQILEHLLTKHVNDIIQKKNILSCSYLKPYIEKTQEVASERNIRKSEVRIHEISASELIDIIMNPNKLVDKMGLEYFLKGKADKLMTLAALESSKVIYFEGESGRFTNGERLGDHQKRELLKKLLPKEVFNRPNLILFIGYQYRAEPTGGMVANEYVLSCQNTKNPDYSGNKANLIVFWPRVFLNNNSNVRMRLLRDLKNLTSANNWNELNSTSVIGKYMTMRHQENESAKYPSHIQYRNIHYGTWKDDVTVARIFRRYATVVVLNDAILFRRRNLEQSNKNKKDGQKELDVDYF